MAAAPDGSIYIGTSLLNQGRIDERGKDVLLRYKGYAGGRIFRSSLRKNFRTPAHADARLRPGHSFAADLGVLSPRKRRVAHLRERSALRRDLPRRALLRHGLKTGKIVEQRADLRRPSQRGAVPQQSRGARARCEGPGLGTGDYGALFDYSPDTGDLTQHPRRRIPSEMGREYKAIVDAMVLNRDGTILRRTSDGFIFRFDPEAMTIQNLGKPIWQQRIRGLAFSQDGDLWASAASRAVSPGLRLSNTSRVVRERRQCSTSTGRRTTRGWPTRPRRWSRGPTGRSSSGNRAPVASLPAVSWSRRATKEIAHATRNPPLSLLSATALILIRRQAGAQTKPATPGCSRWNRIFASQDFAASGRGPRVGWRTAIRTRPWSRADGGEPGRDLVLYRAESGSARFSWRPPSSCRFAGASEPIAIEDYAWSPDGKVLMS